MPRVSVLMPAYQAGRTFRRSLESLKVQRYKDFELILVETGPPCGISQWLEQHWPKAIYIHEQQQMLPHDALNLAFEMSHGELCVFTDIDAYAEPDWLALLAKAYDRYRDPVVGGVRCFGDRLIDRAAHIVKFDKWLPGLAPQVIDEGPTINFLIPRRRILELGGFRADTIHADTDISWRLRQGGDQLRLVPTAVVEHHHFHSWWSLISERYIRGASYAAFLASSSIHRPKRPFLRGLIGLLPLRLMNQLWRVSRHAVSAGLWFDLVATFPIVLSGLYAWLLGESIGYLNQGSSVD